MSGTDHHRRKPADERFQDHLERKQRADRRRKRQGALSQIIGSFGDWPTSKSARPAHVWVHMRRV